MLTCTLKNENGRPDNIEWHVGYKFPITYIEIENVKRIYVDEDEFEHIKNNFENLVYPKNVRSCIYFGDIAKTIAYFLYQKY